MKGWRRRGAKALLPGLAGLVLPSLLAFGGTAHAGNVSFWIGSPSFGAWSGHGGSGFWLGWDGLLIGAQNGGLWVSAGYPFSSRRHFDHRDHRRHSRWGHGPFHAPAYATYPDGRPYAPLIVAAPVRSAEAPESTPAAAGPSIPPHGVFYDGHPVRGAGRLSLSGLPENARVLIDGIPIREREISLLSGAHRVEIHAPGFRSSEKNVEIRMNELHDLSVAMTKE